MKETPKWINSLIKLILQIVILLLIAINIKFIYSIFNVPLQDTMSESTLCNLEDVASQEVNSEPDIDLRNYTTRR
jgi:hypothetical protein